MWIRLTRSGGPLWVNTVHVRRFESVDGTCRIVYTSQDAVRVDQSLDEVMEALGYKPSPKPPLEVHLPAELEDHPAEFVG